MQHHSSPSAVSAFVCPSSGKSPVRHFTAFGGEKGLTLIDLLIIFFLFSVLGWQSGLAAFLVCLAVALPAAVAVLLVFGLGRLIEAIAPRL